MQIDMQFSINVECQINLESPYLLRNYKFLQLPINFGFKCYTVPLHYRLSCINLHCNIKLQY